MAASCGTMAREVRSIAAGDGQGDACGKPRGGVHDLNTRRDRTESLEATLRRASNRGES